MEETNTKDFHRRCGEVLRFGFDVENLLDFVIPNYFSFPQTSRTRLLKDEIILKLPFEKKIQILKKICKEEGVEESALSELVAALAFVKDARNKVAHYERVVQNPISGEIRLWPPTSSKKIEDSINLTDKFMEEVNEKRGVIYKEVINRLYLKVIEKLVNEARSSLDTSEKRHAQEKAQ